MTTTAARPFDRADCEPVRRRLVRDLRTLTAANRTLLDREESVRRLLDDIETALLKGERFYVVNGMLTVACDLLQTLGADYQRLDNESPRGVSSAVGIDCFEFSGELEAWWERCMTSTADRSRRNVADEPVAGHARRWHGAAPRHGVRPIPLRQGHHRTRFQRMAPSSRH